MSRRFVTLSGWLVAAVMVSAGGLVPPAASQGVLPLGAFVIAEDGTRWVVGHGARFRIAFVPDDSKTVPTLAEGVTVALGLAVAVALGWAFLRLLRVEELGALAGIAGPLARRLRR